MARQGVNADGETVKKIIIIINGDYRGSRDRSFKERDINLFSVDGDSVFSLDGYNGEKSELVDSGTLDEASGM